MFKEPFTTERNIQLTDRKEPLEFKIIVNVSVFITIDFQRF